ncbi:N-acetyltransferase [Mechercharimyces sp. CAU 1602]|uniref:GNAT family N-acetyltransferase n=1 Tax=Mechercharimyces sp. CAU 1602 TaxID=2973933 RepID=UPI002161BAA5|nr:GNAT family N-acetyltransferase [Mechercharimyces sp. CAU 1602]MCS1351496.1 GNAT family N-acetyltransferase [Mechercharimyces sp. CAU 1602]
MINLVRMNEEQFSSFFEETVREYAEEYVKEGRWTPSESIERATKEANELLPKGIQTNGHFLCSLHHEVVGIIGTLWYAVKTNMDEISAFIYSIQINEEFQGKGYGKQALIALETELAPMNVSSIGLHVFGHNKRAHQLYTKMGYIPTSIKMKKHLRGM